MRLALPALLLLAPAIAGAGLLLDEPFADNPIGTRAIVSGDASRFSYDIADNTLTAGYDLSEPHSRLAWPLARALDESDTFTATVEFTLAGVDFEDFDLGQLSFGFINRANTGSQRTASPGDCWECLTLDYFPASTYPTLAPTFVRQDEGSGDALTSASLKFPDGTASLINDFGEIGSLPEAVRLTATLGYDAATRMITLALADVSGGLAINAIGANPDGDPSTIQLQLDALYPFAFDAFALLLWQHSDGGSAQMTVHSIMVEAAPRDLIASAFPNGVPDPEFSDGVLSLTYQRDLTQAGITVHAEGSGTLKTWSPVPHSVLSAGPGYEIRKAATALPFLRFRVTRP